jgi:tetratricopeptide (TPR) repeat protein
MRGRRTKLSACWVVGHRDGRHCLRRNGEVAFEGDRIVFVGHGFSGGVEEQRDYGMALIAPGFIDLDALGDLDTTILGFDNQPAWRKGRVWPRSYVERGPYEIYSPEELAFQKRYVLANAAYALAYFGEDIGAMMALADRAVALNPNAARSWALSAYLSIWTGQLEIALEHHEVSDRLSPRARVGTSAAAIGGVHFLARRFDEAVPKLLLAIQEDPSFPQAYRHLAACYAHMGRLDGRERSSGGCGRSLRL